VGHAGDDFYLQTMVNRCVGCGSLKELVRFSIVPHVFRCQFPLRFKEHSSHDIVLLCHECFVPASDVSQDLRRRHLKDHGLYESAEKGAPSPFIIDQEKLKARGAAVALLHPKLPVEVRLAKEAIVRAILGRTEQDPLTEADLESVRNTVTRIAVDGYLSPEVVCANRLGITADSECGDDGSLEQRCLEFVVGWRRCFLESVQPKFLPTGWDVQRSIRKHDDLFGPGPPEQAAGAGCSGMSVSLKEVLRAPRAQPASTATS